MKYLFLILFSVGFTLHAQDDSKIGKVIELRKVNSDRRKTFFLKENKRIKVWLWDQKISGKFSIESDSSIVIDEQIIYLKSIHFIRGRTNRSLAQGWAAATFSGLGLAGSAGSFYDFAGPVAFLPGAVLTSISIMFTANGERFKIGERWHIGIGSK